MIKITEYLAAGRPVVAFGLAETRNTAKKHRLLYADCWDLDHFASLVHSLAADGGAPGRIWVNWRPERARELVWERSEVELLGAYERL